MTATAFDLGYAAALKIAAIRVRAAIRTGAFPSADSDDLIQELLVAFWLASGKFDPGRASLRTFLECVLASRLASATRAARRRPPMQLLNFVSPGGVKPDEALFELRVDIARLLGQLDSADLRVAVALMQFPPSEASRELGLSRSTVYRHIGRLQAAFTAAGLGVWLGGNRCNRREE